MAFNGFLRAVVQGCKALAAAGVLILGIAAVIAAVVGISNLITGGKDE